MQRIEKQFVETAESLGGDLVGPPHPKLAAGRNPGTPLLRPSLWAELRTGDIVFVAQPVAHGHSNRHPWRASVCPGGVSIILIIIG